MSEDTKKFAYLETSLAGVPIGGADETKVRTTFKLTTDQEPAYVITVGKKG